jgi:signal transduction histidine kinase
MKRMERVLAHMRRTSKLALWELDVARREIAFTDEIHAVLGTDPATFVPTLDATLGFLTAAGRRSVEAALERASENGEGFDLEVEAVTALRRRLWLRVTGEVVCEEGRPVAIYGSHQDITETKLLAAELAARVVAQDARPPRPRLGVWTHDADTGAAFWSPELFRIHDLAPAESPPPPETREALVHHEDRERLRTVIAEVLKTGLAATIGYRTSSARRVFSTIQRKGQRERLLTGLVIDITGSDSATGIDGRHGGDAGDAGLAHAAIPGGGTRRAEGAFDVVLVLDAAGRVVRCPLAGEAALGAWTPAEVEGHTLIEVLPPSTAVATMLAARRARDSGRTQRFEYDFVAGGTHRVMEACVTSLGEGQILALVRDVTAQRLEREAAHALAEAHAAALRQLGSAEQDERRRIARELHDQAGSSMAAILMTCKLLDWAKSLEDARRLGRRLADQVATTTDELSRLARGLYPPALAEHGLAEMLQRFAAAMSDASARVRLELDPWLLDHRVAPELELAAFRIAQESVSNALKHADPHSIMVRCQRVGRVLELAVEDDGAGFVRSLEEDSGEGGSLGLASMQDRAALVGGMVSIRSVPGEGTSVVARFPLQERQRRTAGPRSRRRPPH